MTQSQISLASDLGFAISRPTACSKPLTSAQGDIAEAPPLAASLTILDWLFRP